MRRQYLAFAGALILLGSAPGWSQGERAGGRAGGGGGPRLGGPGRSLPGNRNPGGPNIPRGRGDAGRGSQTPERGGRRDQPRTQRHRDRNGDGRPDRHFRPRPRIWWPFFGGIGFGAYGYRSPFYDPFYSGFYNAESFDRDGDSEKNIALRIKPENARVHVNGLLYSSKGKNSFDLPMGMWTIEISAPGYQTQVIQLNVEQGIRYRIERKLEKDATQDPRGRPLKEEELPKR